MTGSTEEDSHREEEEEEEEAEIGAPMLLLLQHPQQQQNGADGARDAEEGAFRRRRAGYAAAGLLGGGLVGWLRQLRGECGAAFLAAVMMVYGVNQGFGDSLKGLVTNYYFKDVQGLQPSATQAYLALAGLPWDVKPIYGLITDTFPIAGYKKWPYLAICGAAGTGCYWALAALPATPLLATALLAAAAISTAFPDVVIDAALAQRSRDIPHIASDLQSLSYGSSALGGLIGCGVSGPSVHFVGPKSSFFVLSLATLTLIVAALSLPESRLPKHLSSPNIRAMLTTLRRFTKTVRSSSVWKPALFICLFSGAVCPDINEAMFFWATDSVTGPRFGENFMGLVSALGYVALILGVALYNCFFKLHTFRFMFFWTQVAACIVGLIDMVLVTRWNLRIGIPDHAFVLGDAALSRMIGRVQLMPMLVLSAKLCPPGVEGTVFAFLMSVSNMGRTLAAWLGALLLKYLDVNKDNYSYLWLAVLIRSLMRLLPLLFLSLVPVGTADTVVHPVIVDDDDDDVDDEEGDQCVADDRLGSRGSGELGPLKACKELEMAEHLNEEVV